jgi:hypothetical protein
MIGECQTIGGYERSGAAIVETNRRHADVVEPALAGEEPIASFDLLPGKSVEQPHSRVCYCEWDCDGQDQDKNQVLRFHSNLH